MHLRFIAIVFAEATQTTGRRTSQHAVFDALSDALRSLSLDLVHLVHGYAVFPCASTRSQPRLQCSFALRDKPSVSLSPTCDGLASGPDRVVWVAGGCYVQMFSSDGVFLRRVADGQWSGARGIALDSNGDAYIADHLHQCISVCKADGTFLRRFGMEQHFHHLQYVAIDALERLLFVTDFDVTRLADNSHVRVFSLDGTYVRTWSTGADDKAMFGPSGIAINSLGEIGVCDQDTHRIQVRYRWPSCHVRFRSRFRCLTSRARACGCLANLAGTKGG